MSMSTDSRDTSARYEQLLTRVEANEREFRRLGRSVLRVQEDERRRLARELHDGVGQNLTALKHRLAQLRDAADGSQRSGLESAIALCADTLEDTRELSRLLRPTILDDLGLEPALRWLGRSIGTSAGIAVAVEVEPLPELDGERQTLLFRVAQEALNNIAKHAQARSVLLRLVERDSRLQLQVVDDGIGFDPSQRPSGSGLSGMRERLRLFEGVLEVHSTPGHGTRIRAIVPRDGG